MTGNDGSDVETKMEVIRSAADFSFPTADIDQMLHEIDLGYQQTLLPPTS